MGLICKPKILNYKIKKKNNMEGKKETDEDTKRRTEVMLREREREEKWRGG